jgi:exonuclease III
MRLISFNIWGGTVYVPLMGYLGKLSAETDIFCFQEVLDAPESASLLESHGARVHLFRDLEKLLPDFKGFFAPSHTGHDFEGPINFDLTEGLAVFVKKPLNAASHFYTHIAGQAIQSGRANSVLQQLSVFNRETFLFTLFNFHGLALPGNKLDTPQRLEQSVKIKKAVDAAVGPKILCGDFNLDPLTQSVAILQEDLRNLIKEFGITNTRNKISWGKYPESVQNFADYTFVSPEIKVKNFQAPYSEVSDHLPMILEFSL